ncbi:MAG: linear amide C-N hydrolase [Anaerolineales bacterium]|nr:linear amide C-N hydrolase [Anaerolineales bacterium]
MKIRLTTGILFLCSLLLAGCRPRLVPATPGLPAAPTTPSIPAGLTQEQFTTLSSLQKVDEYPLYTMTYVGAYRPRAGILPYGNPIVANISPPAWACSLFTVLVDKDNLLYGRNFDWQFSPALLLFTNPPDGYASVSMVDIAYLGFDGTMAKNIAGLPIDEKTGLLDAPYLPFDGMNEHGFAIGMAAVPPGDMRPDTNKETIGSLGVIREMLDHARNVDEAVDIMQSYNIDFGGGPPVHYLMADASGKSVLVEYFNGEIHVLDNEHPWHLATNFLRSSVDDPAEGNCWRYNKINSQLTATNGRIDVQAAMQLLADVAQDNTQWSVVYQMSSGVINVAMGQQYQDAHQFQLDLVNP